MICFSAFYRVLFFHTEMGMAVDLLESKVPLWLEAVERGKKQPGLVTKPVTLGLLPQS